MDINIRCFSPEKQKRDELAMSAGGIRGAILQLFTNCAEFEAEFKSYFTFI
jgi:hypothetical protein